MKIIIINNMQELRILLFFNKIKYQMFLRTNFILKQMLNSIEKHIEIDDLKNKILKH